MEKNIYDLINEANMDIDQYEEVKLTKLEEKRMMKKFSQAVNEHKATKRISKKYIGVATAALVIVGTVGAIPTLASTNPMLYKVATFLGIEKDLTSYETVVGKEVVKDGVAMTINEVIMNNEHLLVSVTTKLDEGMAENFVGPVGNVYINGQEVNKGMSLTSKILEDGNGLSVLRIPLGDVTEGDVAIKLSLKTPLTNVSRSAHWDLEFKVNGDTLREETQIVAIEKSIEMGEGDHITLHQYKGNAVEHRITYSGEHSGHKILEIRGTNEKGNEVVFEGGPIFDGTGEFILKSEYTSIIEEAKSLTLAVYDAEEQVSETFEFKK